MDSSETLLSHINSPADLKRLDILQLPQVCNELRQFIIDEVSDNPGHLGANLGAIELTVALHYVFDTPNDKIIWDVGHQAYGHKIITGRKDIFSTNRKYHGISGFPRMEESEYDSFGAGHASISISAALGMAMAFKLENKNRHVVAFIGDGALTGGEAFEGLNNAGATDTDILVILNDNNISIDKSSGALKDYLVAITTSRTYNRIKSTIWNFFGLFERLRFFAGKLLKSIKSTILAQSNLFEGLNFRYFGPVDGHDVVRLVRTLQKLKTINGPKLLHCKTVKGKGFTAAENNQVVFHAPGKFDKHTGERIPTSDGREERVSFQKIFGKTILDLARKNSKIVAVTPAMVTGSALNDMIDELPAKTFDVGIAEPHAVTFSAGMASQGFIPFCCIYSSFFQRAIDQAIHDVALQNLHVVFCIDRAGLVGHDGATHHGFFDMAFLRAIPNMIVSAPMDGVELRNLLYTAQLPENSRPFAIRYPRGFNPIKEWEVAYKKIEIGKARCIANGNDIAILSVGAAGNEVVKAMTNIGDKVSVEHWDMRFVKPIDREVLKSVGSRFKTIITIEDGILSGGFGSSVVEFLSDNNFDTKVIRMGIPDYFVQHGNTEELICECGFDSNSIEKTILAYTDN